jgi:hypothetical protein
LDLDAEFQSRLPNNMVVIEGQNSMEMTFGRREDGPTGGQVIAIPSEAQRSRLVAQLTLQNLLVLGVGNWESEEELQPAPTATPGGRTQGEESGPQRPNVVTLALSAQDALVLKYVQEAGASMTLVLRRSGDEGQVETQAVTLQYLLERFRIEAPPKLPLGVDTGPSPVQAQQAEN